jgi:hypothetical protein
MDFARVFRVLLHDWQIIFVIPLSKYFHYDFLLPGFTSHISNFHPIQYEIIFLYPIYVLPQFFMGLILGWLRIQYGFLWAVLFHILVNGLFTWPKALLMLWNS